MPTQRPAAEEIIGKLREADVLLSQGRTVLPHLIRGEHAVDAV